VAASGLRYPVFLGKIPTHSAVKNRVKEPDKWAYLLLPVLLRRI
jgi:hypothetical protein